MRFCSAVTLLLGLFVSNSLSQAPDTLWTQLYGGEDSDRAYDVQQTIDDGFIFVGSTTVPPSSERDLYIVKTNEYGEEEWNQVYGGSEFEEGVSVELTADGGYIVLSRTTSFGSGGEDIWLLKINQNGDEEWCQFFGGNNVDVAKEVLVSNDGGFIVFGSTNSYGNGDKDFWLIKTDSLGEEIWNQTYGDSSGDYAYGISNTHDGGYILTGITSTSEGSSDLWLIKVDPFGNEEWNQTFGGNNNETGTSVIQAEDGGFIIAGANESINNGNRDWWLIKTNSLGIMEWDQTYGGDDYDMCNCVEATSDGGYILGGWTPSFGAGSTDIWVVKTDSMGNEEWNQTFGSHFSDWTASVKQTSDNGYIIAGSRNPTITDEGRDAWLIRLGSESGIVEPQTPIPSNFEIQSIYPNPFNAQTTITINLPETSNLRLSVHNLLGQEVDIITHGKHPSGTIQFNLNANNLPSGIYFVHAQVNGQVSKVKKVVLMK